MTAAGREPLGVIGIGWVGLVTAVAFADLGHEVWCIDIDTAKLAALARGENSLHEPELTSTLVRTLPRLHFTDDPAELFGNARLAFVCVDTPPTASGDADLSRVEDVIAALPEAAAGALLVMKSTVPVGTGERLRHVLDARGLDHVGYASNPEFLREGSALADFRKPDRVVIGASDPADAERLSELYAPISDCIVVTDVPSAEMIKLASNAFLATKILVHQRDRERVRGGGRERRGGGPRHGPRLAHRAQLPERGHRVRRQLLPEGRRCAQATRGQLRLPLPAARVGDRGQLDAEAPRGDQAAAPPGLAARPPGGDLGHGVQAGHERHARGLEHRARRPARRRGRDRDRLRPGGRHRARGALPAARGAGRRRRPGGGGWRGRGGHRDGMAPVPRARAVTARQDGDAAADRRTQPDRPGGRSAAGLAYEGIGRMPLPAPVPAA